MTRYIIALEKVHTIVGKIMSKGPCFDSSLNKELNEAMAEVDHVLNGMAEEQGMGKDQYTHKMTNRGRL